VRSAPPSARVRWKRAILPLVWIRHGRIRFGLISRSAQSTLGDPMEARPQRLAITPEIGHSLPSPSAQGPEVSLAEDAARGAPTVEDGDVTRWQRVVVWTGAVILGVAVAALGAYFTVIGLDKADKLGSAVGAVVGLAGLGVTGYGIALTVRSSRRDRATSQVVASSTIRGGVTQVRGVTGGVRIGPKPMAAPRPILSAPSTSPPAESGGQSVMGSHLGGPVRQVDDVDGDVDVDR
jgi:hypothetical protein